MATGGIFQLITNDGKQDRMLLASALLNKRLYDIEQARKETPGVTDYTPTLVDIERTHILFMNAHFKPFCAIGYEYNKTNPTGSVTLGAQSSFSIPQFGDFFHDMVLHLKLGSVTAHNAAYWTTPTVNPATGAELVAYVDWLGQRIVAEYDFTVNGNPLDKYNVDVMNFHQKFFVTPNKQTGWKRCMAQEVPKVGYQNMYRSASGYGRGSGVRQELTILDGPQTPKITQPAIEMWIPLLFWFNKDVRLAIPSVSIPYGQRYINVTFNTAANLLQTLHAYDPALDSPGTNTVTPPEITNCELYINNIFVNPEIHDVFIKRIGFSLIRVHRLQNITVNKAQDELLMNQLKWPIETIYFGLRPSANVDAALSSMRENWHLYCEVQDATVDTCAIREFPPPLQVAIFGGITTALVDAALGFVNPPPAPPAHNPMNGAGQVLISFVAWFGAVNVTVPMINQWLGYYGYPLMNPADFANPLIPNVGELTAFWPSINTFPAVAGQASGGVKHCQVRYKTMIPTLSQLTVQAHGIPLYRDLPTTFFNSYIPFTYGGQHINTPQDIGAYMLTFNLYPGIYQPSGHVNISRAREFYLNYVSPQIGTSIPSGDFVIIGIAINFLLVSDGSAVLRYST
jgi:hypothetical protein